jgi:CHAP domain
MISSILDIARGELGKEEIPRGSNWGADVQKYLAWCDIHFPASWCMAFVGWCAEQHYKQLGIPNPLIKTGGVMKQWHDIDDRWKADHAAPGDIFIMDFGGGLGHTGFVESIDDHGNLHTIEGNTNDTGSREGYEVCRRIRHESQMKGFIRIA